MSKLKKANLLFSEKKYQAAIKEYNKILKEIDPENSLRICIENNIHLAEKRLQEENELELIFRKIRSHKTINDLEFDEQEKRYIDKIINWKESTTHISDLNLFKIASIYAFFCKISSKTSNNYLEKELQQRFSQKEFDSEFFLTLRIAFLATYPAREQVLKNSIQHTSKIFDKIYIYLNQYDKIPDFLSNQENIIIVHGLENIADNGKFFNWHEGSEEKYYKFCIDDDLFYPEDYAVKLSHECYKLKDKAVVGLHGVILKSEISNYYKSRFVYNFKSKQTLNLNVDILGTGTICYKSNLIEMTSKDLSITRMVDLCFALYAQKRNIALVSIKRPENYLIELEELSNIIEKTSIYKTAQEDEKENYHTFVMASAINEFKESQHLNINDNIKNMLENEKELDSNSLIELNNYLERIVKSGHKISMENLRNIFAYTNNKLSNCIELRKCLIFYLFKDIKDKSSIKEIELLCSVNEARSIIKDYGKYADNKIKSTLIQICTNERSLIEFATDALTYETSMENFYLITLMGLFLEKPAHFIKELCKKEVFALGVIASLINCIKNEVAINVELDVCKEIIKNHYGEDAFQSNAFFNSLLGFPLIAENTKNHTKETDFAKFAQQLKAIGLDLELTQIEKIAFCLGMKQPQTHEEKFKYLYDSGNISFLSYSGIKNNELLNYCSEINTLNKNNIEMYNFSINIDRIIEENLEHKSQHGSIKEKTAVIFTTRNPNINLLKKSLISIATQIKVSIDIYIIDDASDNTKELNEALKEAKEITEKLGTPLYILRNEISLGTYTSRNIALHSIPNLFEDYEFICFHDDDDISLPFRLYTQIQDLKKDSTLLVSRAKHARVIHSKNCISYENEGNIFGYAPICSLYRTCVFKDLGYFDNVISRGDVEFLNRIASAYGEKSIFANDNLVMLCSQNISSLSWTNKFAKGKMLNNYKKSYRQFHNQNQGKKENLFLNIQSIPRKFIAPMGLVSIKATMFDFNKNKFENL